MDPVLALLVVLTILAAIILAVVLLRTRTDSSAAVVEALRAELRTARGEAGDQARAQREELQASFRALSDGSLSAQGLMRQEIAANAERVREGVTVAIRELQTGNEKKLEEMRATVDEKLQGTLEKRLSESFALVSERLEAVQRGLGEMQQLATGVGDLKKVLGNVSTRGAFGELQLRAILEQMLAPDQYVENFQANPATAERVEFAIVLPGRDGPGSTVHLPVDSKFPQEDYLRLVDAGERADTDGMQAARSALVRAIRNYAREVAGKYLHVPRTTDFAIIFLPTEGLYAEVLRERGV
ncbi:MAG: DNA recombination protein RmuC, partial [Gemmatimonadales bacterium]|nr:DNA recombination protein RmuC [Gemmatimonadales bacterium]